MPELSGMFKNQIRTAIAGIPGEKIRINCPACAGSGGQEKTLEIRTEDGFCFCFRCKLSGYLDRPETRPGHEAATMPGKSPAHTPEEKAAWIYDHAEAIPEGFTGHEYLKRKGIPGPPGVKLWKGALLIPLRSPGENTIKALQFIDAGGNKRFLKGCQKKGAAFLVGRLDPVGRVCIAEGVATGASVHQTTGLPVFCSMDSGNLKPVAEAVRLRYPDAEIIFSADNDRAKPPGSPGFDEGFLCAIEAARAVGGRVAMPEIPGHDFNDLLSASGPEAVKAAIDAAADPPPVHALPSKPPPADPPGPGNPKRDPRPVIRLSAGKIHEAIDAAEKILIQSGEEIYNSGADFPVRPIQTIPGKRYGEDLPEVVTIWQAVTVPYLVYILNSKICFQKFDKRVGENGDFLPTNCPRPVAEGLLSKVGAWRFPVVTGLSHVPLIRFDGSITSQPGYDPQTGSFIALNAAFLSIPENPSKEDAEAALSFLREAIASFPFDNPVSESVAVAAMITAVIRPSLNLSPLFLISAAAAGSGKSMFCDGLSILSTGLPAAVSDPDEDAAERKNHLDSLILQGVNFLALDNLEAVLKGGRLTQLLTAERVSVRVKGFTKEMSVFHSVFACATGNNAAVGGDLPRRTLIAYIDAKTERPEKRKFPETFQALCRRKRGELVRAGLTIVKAYAVAGRPEQLIPALGSFEMWSLWVRSPLVWLGLEDPVKSQDTIRAADISELNLKALFEAWREAFGDTPQTAKAGVRVALDRKGAGDDCLHDAIENVALDRKGGGLSPHRLGAYFRKHKNRILNGLQLVAAGTEARAALWCVLDRRASAPDPETEAPALPEDPAPEDIPAIFPAYDGRGSVEI